MPKVRLALCQTNPVVGDFDGNLKQIFDALDEAKSAGANLALFGEMSLCGYPVEDLAFSQAFLIRNQSTLDALKERLATAAYDSMTVVVGLASQVGNQSGSNWAIAQNTAVALRGNTELARYAKHHLPNYSVFDEYRNFVPGDETATFELLGLKFGLAICEDIWQSGGPVSELANHSVDVALVLNGSPFEIDKDDRRLSLAQSLSQREGCAVAYTNLVGGQDDLVFDGDSFLVSAGGELIGRAKQFASDVAVFDILDKNSIEAVKTQPLAHNDDNWQIWNALVLGLRDYVAKSGFKSVILGLSGGIDSAVCAAIAVDALGPERVFGVSLPSKYSSDHSRSDAQDLAERLGISFRTEPIGDAVAVVEKQLALDGVAAENLQARTRAVILMGLSNQDGHLLLTTGNKTEISVGYSTIYGDSAGGYAPIKDVPKTLVWKLAEYRNLLAREAGETEPIPQNSITKPPSAELRPGQVDQDSLPEYEILDGILELYINERSDLDSIVDAGFDEETVRRVLKLVNQSEWKRRQAAIGPKITRVAFGKDRRVPITHRFDNKTN